MHGKIKSTTMLRKNRDVLQNFAEATQHEWLETNGLGGWAGSSIIGVNTRRYHGLLVAAIVPPAERMVLLSKLDETIVIDWAANVQAANGQAADSDSANDFDFPSGQTDARYELGVNLYRDDIISPTGHQYLTSFSKDIFPQWEYEVEGILLKKTIVMVHGENTVVIHYEVIEAPQPFTLELLPLMAARGYHALNHEGPQMQWAAEFDNGLFHNRPDGKNDVFIMVPASTYQHTPRWFNNFQCKTEQYRGLDYTEDLFNHGTFSVGLKKGDTLSIIVSTEDVAGKNAEELLSKETLRRKLLTSNQPNDEMIHQLTLAADQFIVKRTIQLKNSEVSPSEGDLEGTSIIAGYHWFTDWGRDTMISLPGLCLSTGRYDDAKKILFAFAQSVSMGMLPNRFLDNGEEPEYNNADATLWYFIAVNKYLEATGDTGFVLNGILPVLKDIIDWHYKGTRYNIHVDEDHLLFAGEEGQQLTWMDARIGSWVVTPRMGKPVEIEALWYNALKIFAGLLLLNGQENDARLVNVSAEKLKQSFEQLFWYEQGNYLYDNIDREGKPVAEFRPNQLFAISLPFALIEGDKARAILQMIEEQLYTPVGLRTLPRSDARYVPVYGGDQFNRDAAYHEGTVWSWLLGPYVDALMKVKTEKSKVKKVIDDFAYHLNEACIGSVSEIFDAEPPHHPRGCIAQAWGVAEVLRVIKDHELYKTNTVKPEELRFEAAEI
jgi:predicted glycogen debranching enzyme